MLKFCVLGPVEAWRNGREVELNGRKVRAMLAALLLQANQVVRIERLVAVLWGERPPPTAVAQLHKYVSQLRAKLGPECIIRHGAGYQIKLEQNVLDLHAFNGGVRAARAALDAGRPAEAAGEIASALALWRGAPIANTTEYLIHAEAGALAERRLAATLDKIEIELVRGRHAEVIGELQSMLAQHPLNEKLRRHLMLALYRSGRVGEALAAYHEARTHLAEELGLDPSPELQALHEAILVGDPALNQAGSAGRSLAAPASPAQLPPSIADFTGRADTLDRICQQLSAGGGEALVIVAVSGKGGVGKTTLAVRAARKVVEAYPDGQLYLRLHGSSARPLEPLAALQRFLRALGVEERTIPVTVDECAEMYRSRLATRRILIVLDDAADEAQIRTLLPGSPTCAVLVTSRPRLVGLEGADLHNLDVFTATESVALLTRIAGAQRLGDDRRTVRRIAELCGYLPLAVRIAAARIAQHGRTDLTRFARRLADQRRRLDVLVVGDLEVRASLALGYQGLGAAEKMTFSLLGLLDTPDFAAWVAASLLGVPVEEAEDVIEELVNAQLLDVTGCDITGQTRYRYHDLVRLYARERAEKDLSEEQRHRAISRALGAWLTLAAEADERFHGTRSRGWSPRSFANAACHDPFDPAYVDELLTDPLAWFESERAALVTGVAQAHRCGLSPLAWALAESMTEFLELRHRYADWESVSSRALDACAVQGDEVGTAITLMRLARLRLIRGDRAACVALVERAVRILQEIGQKAIEAEAHIVHAAARRAGGDYETALDLVDHAIVVARASGNGVAETRATRELGEIRYGLSHWREAAEAFQRAVILARRIDNRREEALSLRYLAIVLRHRDQLEESRRTAESALAILHELGDRPHEAFSCLTLGLILLRMRDPAAPRMIGEGRRMLSEMNLGFGTGEALYVQAALDIAEGRTTEGLDRLFESIVILRCEPVHHVLISAVRLLGEVLRLAGDLDAAAAVRRLAGELPALVGEPPPAELLELGTRRVPGAGGSRLEEFRNRGHLAWVGLRPDEGAA
ncbi:AfsR/SARP family transcriptional regulator [Rhizomonospora bruguierae]|uniref:AfsR/SARP family transcriptional regulator n=1 Tax=Rhizomonospora bruguierae TaxID=1581705 RepID=UPI0024BE6FB5|nr:AfsR/SARP family transcriptional regulator [Micromonospora sp. NBRC 107566]